MPPTPAPSAGYSGRPLIDKLGIKSGQRILIRNAPKGYSDTLGPLPKGATPVNNTDEPLQFIHYFTRTRRDLAAALPQLKDALEPGGSLWISWPKKAAKIETDVTEDVVRELALKIGLVDVKVCAVDEIWSGLKLMYRRK